MDEIDEILGVNNNKTKENKEQKSNNVNWKSKQDKDRQEAYDTMEKMANEIKTDGTKFKKYLDIQSRFEKYSVGNCLIVLSNNPNATQFKDEGSWNEKGIELLDNQEPIKILEPSRSKITNRIYYNPKEVYDISQTNANNENKKISYDDRELLKAFFHNCGATKKAVDILPNGEKGAEYNKNENIIYVCKGMDVKTIFQVVSQELANIEMKNEENTEIKDFKSYCISYMLCRKYNIDVSNYNFEELPGEIKQAKTGREVRGKLEEIRKNYNSIYSRISEYFEISEKEKQNKIQER